MSEQLPFDIIARNTGKESVIFIAEVDGHEITSEKYSIGNGRERKRVAVKWSQDDRLRNGSLVSSRSVESELERKEFHVKELLDNPIDGEDNDLHCIETASYIDDTVIAELAWNRDGGQPDFIIYNRESSEWSRLSTITIGKTLYIPPKICRGIVTPGGHIPGMVFVPSGYDASELNEQSLRKEIKKFINRYVQLPEGADDICVEYVFLSWVHDRFDEIPYLAFRTADFGSGKSRALETIGTLCYRPMLCGGGSSAAATLRLLDVFGGTLLCDEFDQKQQTELAGELTRITNQGFQKNRPLVKCDGEANAPRAFRCFGPKLFALRQRFGDDASESRMLSIQMRRRTRASIPVNLPRQQFDREALSIRNKLLAWRFHNLDRIKLIPISDSRLEDRYKQVGTPLLSIAHTDDVRKMIVDALLKQQGTIAADKGDTPTGEVYSVIANNYPLGAEFRPGDIASEINKDRAECEGVEVDKLRSKITSQKVGRIIIHELELPRSSKDSKGARYVADSDRMKELAIRFGGTLPETSLTSQRHFPKQTSLTSSENTLFQAENDDSDINDIYDISTGVDDVSTLSDITNVTIPDGWSLSGWIDRLEKMADACGIDNPEQATEYQKQAAEHRRVGGVK